MTATHATKTGTVQPLGRGLFDPNVAFCGARQGAGRQGLLFTADADAVTCKRCLNKKADEPTAEERAAKKAEREAKEAAETAAFQKKFQAAQAKWAAKAARDAAKADPRLQLDLAGK